MTTWQVLKKVFISRVTDGKQDGWGYGEVGTHESNSQYWIGGSAAQALGEKFGAGEFLLLNDDRVQRLTVAERTEFYEDKAEDTEAIMAREG